MLVAQQTLEMRPASGNGMMAQGQKLLSPEKCSEFLDVQGFALEHNTCEFDLSFSFSFFFCFSHALERKQDAQVGELMGRKG